MKELRIIYDKYLFILQQINNISYDVNDLNQIELLLKENNDKLLILINRIEGVIK